jgi:hypothetical protein
VFHPIDLIIVVSKFIKRKIRANESSMKCPKTSSKVQCAKCQGFGHSFVNCTSKPLVIQEYKDIGEKKDYYVQLYELNLEDISGLDDEDVQKKGLDTIDQMSLKMRLIKNILSLF